MTNNSVRFLNNFINIITPIFIPIYFTSTAIMFMFGVIGLEQNYDTLKSNMADWVFSLVINISNLTPILLISNSLLLVFLWLGFDDNKLIKSFKRKQQSGDSVR